MSASFDARVLLQRRERQLSESLRRTTTALRLSQRTLSRPRTPYLAALLAEEWPRVEAVAAAEIERHAASLNRLAAARDRAWAAAAVADGRSGTSRASGLLPVAKDALGAALRRRGLPPATVERVVRRYANREQPSLWDGPSSAGGRLGAAFEDHLARISELQHARAAANFNILVDGNTSLRAAGVERACESAEQFVEASINALRSYAKRLGPAPRLALSVEGARRSGSTILGRELLPALAAVRQGRQRRNSDEAQQRALRTADAARGVMWMLAVLRVFEADTLWPSEDIGEAWRAAASLPRRSQLRLPRAVSARSLSRRQVGDDLVSVVGIAGPIEITHRARKAVSRLEVFDGDGSVPVEAHGFKLDATGIVEGAAVRLGGTWRIPTGGSRPALLLERFAVAQAAEHSFEDWLAWRTRGVYQRVPHQFMASWSWEAGSSGAINPARYGVTASGRD